MQSNQELPVDGALGEEVMDSLGLTGEGQDQSQESDSSGSENELPKYAKEKLGMQEKRHKKQMKKMQAQLDELRSYVGSQSMNSQPQSFNQAPSMPNNQQSDPMQQAVAAAMQALEQKQKQQKEADSMMHVHKQYQDLQSDLDNASDKYDDFDDVVRNSNVPYSEAMRDAALLLPNRADVLYKLGKNPDDLKKISQLHPIDQAREMVKMSIALMNGSDDKPGTSAVKTMGNIKSNPVSNSSSQVNERTSIADIRKKMKAGWK